jgi:hypothetical protein
MDGDYIARHQKDEDEGAKRVVYPTMIIYSTSKNAISEIASSLKLSLC